VKLYCNTVSVLIGPPFGEPYIVKGKGRNSVSHKVFGMRAACAIRLGMARAIIREIRN
jgi:hypothetical protein